MAAGGTERIDGYGELHRVGHGGFSVVYRARHLTLNRDVAVKVLSVDFVDDDTRRRVLRETELAGELAAHPNVVGVLDTGVTSSGRPYLAMDYYSRGSLKDRVLADGPLSAVEAAAIGAKIARALDAAHQAGILHRDIKPQNILVSKYGEPALADFGTARLAAALDGSSRADALTPLHAAPEVLSGGEPTAASDVYSLGSTLYHLLAGHAAFQRDEDTGVGPLLYRVLNDPLPPLDRPDLPPVLTAAITRAMSRDPAHRFSSALEFAAALDAVTASVTAPTRATATATAEAPAAEPAAAGTASPVPAPTQTAQTATPAIDPEMSVPLLSVSSWDYSEETGFRPEQAAPTAIQKSVSSTAPTTPLTPRALPDKTRETKKPKPPKAPRLRRAGKDQPRPQSSAPAPTPTPKPAPAPAPTDGTNVPVATAAVGALALQPDPAPIAAAPEGEALPATSASASASAIEPTASPEPVQPLFSLATDPVEPTAPSPAIAPEPSSPSATEPPHLELSHLEPPQTFEVTGPILIPAPPTETIPTPTGPTDPAARTVDLADPRFGFGRRRNALVAGAAALAIAAVVIPVAVASAGGSGHSSGGARGNNAQRPQAGVQPPLAVVGSAAPSPTTSLVVPATSPSPGGSSAAQAGGTGGGGTGGSGGNGGGSGGAGGGGGGAGGGGGGGGTSGGSSTGGGGGTGGGTTNPPPTTTTLLSGPGCGAHPVALTMTWYSLSNSAIDGCGNGSTRTQNGNGADADWVFTPGSNVSCVFNIYVPDSSAITTTSAHYQLYDSTGNHASSNKLHEHYMAQAGFRGDWITFNSTPISSPTGTFDLQLYDDRNLGTVQAADVVSATCS